MANNIQTPLHPIQPQQLELLAMNEQGESTTLEDVAVFDEEKGSISTAATIGVGVGVLTLGGIAIAAGSNSSSSDGGSTQTHSNAHSHSNSAASISISGTAQQGKTLTAELIDQNGYSNNVRYQWQANNTNIVGATGKNYTLTAAEVGKTITVQADFTDNAGNVESVKSAPSAAVSHMAPPIDDGRLVGTDGDNVLNGTAGNDILRGGKGKDEMNGGDGDDIFIVVGDVRAGEKVDNDADNAILGGSMAALNGTDWNEEAAGEIIRGGAGNDTLYVIGTVDLSSMIIEGIEKIEIRSDVTISSSQLAAVTAVTGDGNGTLRIHGENSSKVIVLSDAQLSGIRHLDIGSNITLKVKNLSSIAGVEIISGEGGTLQFAETTALTADHSVTNTVNVLNADNSSAAGSAEVLNTIVAARQQGIDVVSIKDIDFKHDLSDVLLNSQSKFFDLAGSKQNDYLSGSAYHDILDGKDGNDILLGKDGNDIYVINGTGKKIVIDGGSDSDIDTLYLGKAKAAAEVDLSKFAGSVGSDTTIQLGAADNRGVAGAASEKTNLMLIIDRSGSMRTYADYNTGESRMDRAQEAAFKLIEKYSQMGDVAIRVIGFDNDAYYEFNGLDAWMNKQEAVDAIHSLTPMGWTDYVVAVDAAETAFVSNQNHVFHPDGKNISLFLSDGEPNGHSYPLGNTDAEHADRQRQWEDFAVKHQITSYAVGFGDVGNIDKLEPIAFDGTQITPLSPNHDAGQIEPILEKNIDQLVSTVTDTAKTDFIENLVGTQFDDKLTGNGLNNEIRGLAGDDVIQGLGGKDYLFGGAGNDTFYKGSKSGSDWLHGGLGYDTVIYGKQYLQGTVSADAVTIDTQLNIKDFTIQVKNLSDNSVDYLYSIEQIELNGISQSAAEWLNLNDSELLETYKPIFYYEQSDATALSVYGEVVRDANGDITGLNYNLRDNDTTTAVDNLFVHIQLGKDLLPTYLYTESTGKTDGVQAHSVFNTQLSRGGEDGNRIKVWADLEGETTYLVANASLKNAAQSELKDYALQQQGIFANNWDFAAQQSKLPNDQGLSLEQGFIYQDNTLTKPDLANAGINTII